MTDWIWQKPQWPTFTWQPTRVNPTLDNTQQALQKLLLLGGAHLDDNSQLDTLLSNIISSSAIEGEQLNANSVRSSLAKRLGMQAKTATTDRSEGLAQLMMDVLNNHNDDLTLERLYQWHGYLFPQNEAAQSETGLNKIAVGQLRGDAPMQVISGRLDRPTVHFEAPPKAGLQAQLQTFIDWFNASKTDTQLPAIIRAGITHFWFITLHPFDDGNGRLARALTDLAMVQSHQQSLNLFSLSLAILNNRSAYYEILEKSQKDDVDISQWLDWFIVMVDTSIKEANKQIETSLFKARFWRKHIGDGLNAGQVKVLNRLLDGGEKGFELGINASQYQKVAKVSKASATRHLSDLLNKNCITKLAAGGRSTRYKITGM
ncbi:MAG: Fic family protein [Bermanella sp.]